MGFKIMHSIFVQFTTMPADMRYIKSLADLNISGNKWVTSVRGRLAGDELLSMLVEVGGYDFFQVLDVRRKHL